MIIKIKKLIVESSPLLNDIQNTISQNLNRQIEYGRAIKKETEQQIAQINKPEIKMDDTKKYMKENVDDPTEQVKTIYESIIISRRNHLDNSIDPQSISKDKSVQDLNAVIQSGSSHAAGLNPGSRAKIEHLTEGSNMRNGHNFINNNMLTKEPVDTYTGSHREKKNKRGEKDDGARPIIGRGIKFLRSRKGLSNANGPDSQSITYTK